MKKVVIVILAIVLLGGGIMFGLRIYTKSHSPTETVSYKDIISVTYSRPEKKGREIFGSLVPYDSVWRTGANEATIFKTTQNLKIFNRELPAGSYSLFTIPGKEEWHIILNSETGQWGIDINQRANRRPANDVLNVVVPASKSSKTIEQFTILFEEVHEDLEMVMMWNKTVVSVPISLE